MRFKPESEWSTNSGLDLARARLEPLKREFPKASFGDLWSFAGTVAIEEMGSPRMNWREGRRDADAPKSLPERLLPDENDQEYKENPVEYLRQIFSRMGFNDREFVLLSAARALGRW